MLLMMKSDSTVWVVLEIENQSGEQKGQIGNAQNLHRINQRKGKLVYKK